MMEEPNIKIELMEKLASELGERKSITQKQLNDIIHKQGIKFEPGELEDYLSASDVVVTNTATPKVRRRTTNNNVWLYSQDINNVVIMSKDEELDVAKANRQALMDMLELIPSTTVTLQRFLDLSEDPEFFGLFRLMPEIPGRRQQTSETSIILERMKNTLSEIRKADKTERSQFIAKLRSDILLLSPSFKIFDRMTGVFEKIFGLINENKNSMKTMVNIFGIPQDELENADIETIFETIRKKNANHSDIASMFNISGLLKHESKKTLVRFKRRKQRLVDICLIDYSDLPDTINRFRQCMDKYQVTKRRLVESNVRLVMNIAKNYTNYGLDYMDIVQEGNHALVNAIERFDPERGYRLSTYSSGGFARAYSKLLHGSRIALSFLPMLFRGLKNSVRLKESSEMSWTEHRLIMKLPRK
jgi:RNA polymerase primary sigma factor